MLSIKFENVWTYLKNYDLIFDNPVCDSLICIICGKVLIDAKQSKCGCRYCYECLKKHIADGLNSCPGNREDCDQITLNESDVFSDHHANRDISNLIVKCHFNSCNFKGPLRYINDHFESLHISEEVQTENMNISKTDTCKFCELQLESEEMKSSHFDVEGDNLCDKYRGPCPYKCGETEVILKSHLRLCTYKPLECPLSNLGCDAENILPVNMADHLYQNGFGHYKILLEMFSNLSNELKNNQRELNVKVEEIHELRSKLSSIETQYNRLNEENKVMKDEIQALKGNDPSDNPSSCVAGATSGATNWQEIVLRNESDIAALQRSVNQHDLKYERKYSEFIWKVDNYSQIVQDAAGLSDIKPRFSKHFFPSKNGYKIRLYISLSKNLQSISVSFQLMKSIYDDVLVWPFMFDISISILDQSDNSTKIDHTRYLFYDPSDTSLMRMYERPINEFNKCCGIPTFIDRDVLESSPNWLKNDTLYVKFCIKPINLSE